MYNFIHIPKTGGVSFRSLIKGHENVIQYCGHTRIKDIKTVAFVRNPYGRIVSAYYYLITDHLLATSLPHFRELALQYNDVNDFIMSIEKDDLTNKILHLKPQHYWIYDYSGILANRVFKIEELESIEAFIQELGIDTVLGKENTSEHPDFKDILTAETISEVNRIYAKDFELFNYEMI